MLRRQAFTLVETVLVLTALCVVFVTAGRTVVRLLQVQKQAVHEFRMWRALERLAEDFRADVHSAIAAFGVSSYTAGRKEEDASSAGKSDWVEQLFLRRADGSCVVYKNGSKGVVRLVFALKQFESRPALTLKTFAKSKPLARELYRTEPVKVRFKLEKGRQLVQAFFAFFPCPKPEEHTGKRLNRVQDRRPVLVVEAAVGLTERLTARGEYLGKN